MGRHASREANTHRDVLPGQNPWPKVPGAPMDFAGVLPEETGWPKATLFGQGAARARMPQQGLWGRSPSRLAEEWRERTSTHAGLKGLAFVSVPMLVMAQDHFIMGRNCVGVTSVV